MKVYKFFRIPCKDDDKDDFDIERKYTLYAITNNKEYAARFKEERNMKKFICKTHSNVTKEEYAEMCNVDRGSVLNLETLVTIFNNNHTLRNSEKKKVLMTYWEKQALDSTDTLLDNEQQWQLMPYPLIFKPKYVKTLGVFEYINYYKLMTVGFLPDRFAEKLSNEDLDYSVPALSWDEVALFIKVIRDTL